MPLPSHDLPNLFFWEGMDQLLQGQHRAANARLPDHKLFPSRLSCRARRGVFRPMSAAILRICGIRADSFPEIDLEAAIFALGEKVD